MTVRKLISLAYGQLPTEEQFSLAFQNLIYPLVEGGFRFANDKRVGTCIFSELELWEELKKAVLEWECGPRDKKDKRYWQAGDWCSSVLQCLGFEWI
jgi:hypothetical protein